MPILRSVALAIALVAAQGCRKPASERHADQAADKLVDSHDATAVADFQARRELRFESLDAQLGVIATQPMLITAMADAFPLTEAGRAEVTDKLQKFQMRVDEAKNQIGLVHTSLAGQFKDADDKAQTAMKKLDDARKDAWDALDKAPRTDRST